MDRITYLRKPGKMPLGQQGAVSPSALPFARLTVKASGGGSRPDE